MVSLTQEELAALKGEGFLLEKDKEHFVCRIVFPAGMASSEEMIKAAEIAKEYGNGTLVATVRLNMELPGILPENIAPMKEAMQKAGLSYGGTGACVRPLVSCKGTVCKFGLIDTQNLCRELHEFCYQRKLPHKFKINITGCPNNCAKAQLNDVGFMGAPKNKVRLFIGGKFGRQWLMGEEIGKIPVEKAKDATEICLLFFEKYGKAKQRFGDLLAEKKETEEYKKLIEDLKNMAEG